MPALPRNDEIADQLDLLADLSEILGEQSFRVLAYRRAATRIRETAASVAELALEGKAKELPGIGKTIETKIGLPVVRQVADALRSHRWPWRCRRPEASAAGARRSATST